MAKLTKRQNGGYFIRGPLKGSMCTWQINQAGLEFLKSINKGHEGAVISLDLIGKLKSHRFIHTAGSGLTLTDWVAGRASLELNIENLDSPQVGLALPVLPLEYTAEQTRKKMAECVLVLDRIRVSAISIWDTSKFVAVSPRTGTYVLSKQGPWPDTWDLQKWLSPIQGLSNGPNFFVDYGSGIKLVWKGGAIPFGKDCYCLIPHSQTEHIKREFVEAELGRVEDWTAFRLKIDGSNFQNLQDWFENLGHKLYRPSWKAILVSPPTSGTAKGPPLVSVGENFLLAFRNSEDLSQSQPLHIQIVDPEGLEESVTLSPKTQLISVKTVVEGFYVIFDADERCEPFLVKAVPIERNTVSIGYTNPFAVSVDTDGEEKLFAGFEACNSVNLSHAITGQVPRVSISIPEHFKVAVTFAQGKRVDCNLNGSEAAALITNYLQGIDNKATEIGINAENLGSTILKFGAVANEKLESYKQVSTVPWCSFACGATKGSKGRKFRATLAAHLPPHVRLVTLSHGYGGQWYSNRGTH